MGFCSWFIFGGLAGWAASILTGTSSRHGCLTNVVLGVVGAFVGGLLMSLVRSDFGGFGFDLPSFGVAILGAILLLLLTGTTRRRRE